MCLIGSIFWSCACLRVFGGVVILQLLHLDLGILKRLGSTGCIPGPLLRPVPAHRIGKVSPDGCRGTVLWPREGLRPAFWQQILTLGLACDAALRLALPGHRRTECALHFCHPRKKAPPVVRRRLEFLAKAGLWRRAPHPPECAQSPLCQGNREDASNRGEPTVARDFPANGKENVPEIEKLPQRQPGRTFSPPFQGGPKVAVNRI